MRTRILNPASYHMTPNLLEPGQPNHITPHNFDHLFHSMNIQVSLPGGKWASIRPMYRQAQRGQGNGTNIPYLYGLNGSGAITPGDWIEAPVPVAVPFNSHLERQRAKGKRAVFSFDVEDTP